MRCKFSILLTMSLLLPMVSFARTHADENFLQWAQAQQKKSLQIVNNHSSEVQPILKTSQRQQAYLQDARQLLKENKSTIHPVSVSKHTFIFVSFSMPLQSLQQWLSQAQQHGGVLVLRGLVDQSFKKTANRVAEVLGDQKGGLQIDPNLFKKYHITQVPAVVQVHEDESYDVVCGDIGLSEALHQFKSL